MELKSTWVSSSSFLTAVLIVPLWNWNVAGNWQKFTNLCFNRTFMELKLGCCYWRWCWSACFNRTFMELKLIWCQTRYWRRCVLIVPLWNWNLRIQDFHLTTVEGFNRTFMELKLIWPLWPWRSEVSFNRTFMELKFEYGCLCSCKTACFNRTFMELK